MKKKQTKTLNETTQASSVEGGHLGNIDLIPKKDTDIKDNKKRLSLLNRFYTGKKHGN